MSKLGSFRFNSFCFTSLQIDGIQTDKIHGKHKEIRIIAENGASALHPHLRYDLISLEICLEDFYLKISKNLEKNILSE